MVALEPYYRIHWAAEDRHLDFVTDREQMKAELAKFSSRDAQAFDGFMDALRPIYEEGILGAGRRSFDRPVSLASFLPTMLRLGAALPLHTFVSRHFENERIREAMGFHSLFIGGDPFRVPRSTARWCTCSSSMACTTHAAGCTRSCRPWLATSISAPTPAWNGSSTRVAACAAS